MFLIFRILFILLVTEGLGLSVQLIPEIKIDFLNGKYKYKIENVAEKSKSIKPLDNKNPSEEIEINIKEYKLTVSGELIPHEKLILNDWLESLNVKKVFDIKINLKDYNKDGIFEIYELLLNTTFLPFKPKYKVYQLALLKKDGTPEIFLQNIADIEILKLDEKDGDFKKFLKTMSNPGDFKRVNDKVYLPDYLPNWFSADSLKENDELIQFDKIVESLLKSVPLKPEAPKKDNFSDKVINFISFKASLSSMFRQKFLAFALQIGSYRRLLFSGKDEFNNPLTEEKLKEIITEITKIKAELTAAYNLFQRIDKAATILDILGIATTLGFCANDLIKIEKNAKSFQGKNKSSYSFSLNEEGEIFQFFQRLLKSPSFKAGIDVLKDSMLKSVKTFISLFDVRILPKIIPQIGAILKDPDARNIFIARFAINEAMTVLAIYANNGGTVEGLIENAPKAMIDFTVSTVLSLSFQAATQKIKGGGSPIFTNKTYTDQYLNSIRMCNILNIPIDTVLNYSERKMKKNESLLSINKDDVDYLYLRINFLFRYNAFFQSHYHIMFDNLYHSKFADPVRNISPFVKIRNGKNLLVTSDLKFLNNSSQIATSLRDLSKNPLLGSLISEPAAYPIYLLQKWLATTVRLNLRDSILKAKNPKLAGEDKGSEYQAEEINDESVSDNDVSEVKSEKEKIRKGENIYFDQEALNELVEKSEGEERENILSQINMLYFLDGSLNPKGNSKVDALSH